MEATGRNDGSRWPWRCHREQTGSSSHTISSSSGTVSTTYTSNGSRPSFVSIEAAMHLDFEMHGEETLEEQMKCIRNLVQEFFGVTSASIKDGDIGVLERWFTELGVGWVLHVPDGESAGKHGHTSTFDTWSWIRALTEIMQTIRLTTSLFPVRGLVGMPSICEEEHDTESSMDQFKFARFFQETMLKMLSFVDVIVSEVLVRNGVPVPPYMKLSNLLGVHGALSNTLSEIWLLFHSPPSAQVERIEREMVSLLSAKEAKVGEAIWSTMQQIWTCIMESIWDCDCWLGTPTLQGSPDIHKAISSAMTYIKFLHKNYFSVAPIVSEAANLGKYVPQIGDLPPFISLVVEMTSCVQEKLANKSESFTDQGLRFLFLLNHSYFILKHLDYPTSSLKVHVAAVTHKLNGYMESYILVSWAPILSWLFNPTPLCFWKNCSPLSKFESEFQKIYTTQEQWKVPDPELRKMLREAITEKIVPGYIKYIEDNNVTAPKYTPQKLKEMLQELFEG
ncbi:unnamed protein product [Urochloa humidicola]